FRLAAHALLAAHHALQDARAAAVQVRAVGEISRRTAGHAHPRVGDRVVVVVDAVAVVVDAVAHLGGGAHRADAYVRERRGAGARLGRRPRVGTARIAIRHRAGAARARPPAAGPVAGHGGRREVWRVGRARRETLLGDAFIGLAVAVVVDPVAGLGARREA